MSSPSLRGALLLPGILTVSSLVLSGAVAPASPCEDYHNISVEGVFPGQPGGGAGRALTVFAEGNLAYVTNGDVLIYDVTDLDSPQLLSTLPTPGFASWVAPAGTVAYVCDGTAGLQIVDVTDPSQPSIIANVPTDSNTSCVLVSGSYAYIGETQGSTPFHVVDVSDPSAPQSLTSLNIANISSMVQAGTSLVLGRGQYDVSLILDLSDPSSPSQIGSLSAGPKSVAATGNTVYGAGSTEFKIWDITDPSLPVLRSSNPMSGADGTQVALVGDFAYVLDNWGGIDVFDVSDPAAAAQVGFVELKGPDTYRRPSGIAVCGDRLLIGQSFAWVQNLKLAPTQTYVPEAGALVLDQTTYPSSIPEQILVSGSYAYLCRNNATVSVLDVSNALSPTVLGAGPAIYARAALDGDTMCFAEYNGSSGGALQVYDLSKGPIPDWKGTYVTTVGPTDVAVLGTHAYLTRGSTGPILVIDVRHKNNPSLDASIPFVEAAGAVAVSGGRLYVADGGLRIFDVSTSTLEAAPVESGSLARSGTYYDLAVDGTTVYVAGETELLVVDAADPALPVLLGTFPRGGARVAVSGTQVLLTEFIGPAGNPNVGPVGVIDMSDPTQPTSVGIVGDVRTPFSVGTDAAGNCFVTGVDIATASDGTFVTVPPPCSPLTTGVEPGDRGSRTRIRLTAAPNPFPFSTRISFVLPAASRGKLRILDVAGRRVRSLWEGRLEAGPQAFVWAGTDDRGLPVPAGIYFSRFTWSGGSETARIVRVP